MPVRAVRRGDDVLVLQRGADADGDGLLADRDVQEPGQLAGAEALLDLLLEAPDQEHLAEELAQDLVGDALSPRLGFLLDGRHRAAIMLIRRCELPISGRFSRRMLGSDWTEAQLSFAPEGSTTAAAAILAPLGPGRVEGELRFHVTRAGSAPQRLETSSNAWISGACGARFR